jgi:chromosome segregation ATPase
MKTTDGYDIKIGGYYYLENGQCVILDTCATTEEDKPAFLVTPFYEGETMKVNGNGGTHNEITAEYEHEGEPTLVTAVFENAPMKKLDEQYKEGVNKIEALSLTAGILKMNINKMKADKMLFERETKDTTKVFEKVKEKVYKMKEELFDLEERRVKKKNKLSELEDSISDMGPANPDSENVLLTRGELQRLNKRDFELHCLEEGGIDNWERYSESLNKFKERYPD